MKLVFAIVSVDDSYDVIKSLIKENYSVTKLSTSGGFLKKKNTTLMIGVENENVDSVVNLIASCSRARKELMPIIDPSSPSLYPSSLMGKEISVGGATIFIVDVEKQIKV